VFETVMLVRDKHYWLNERVAFEALLIELPQDVTMPELRGCRRYRVGDTKGGVYGKIFRRESGQAKEIQATLWDISVGGASFVCPLDKGLQTIQRSELLVVVIHFRGQKIMLPAKLAHTRSLSSKTLRLGLQFEFTNSSSATHQLELNKACLQLDAEGK